MCLLLVVPITKCPVVKRSKSLFFSFKFAPAMTWMRWAWVLAVLHILIKGANPLELKCGADHNCNMLPDMADPANLRHLKCVPATLEMFAHAPPLGGLTLGRGVAQTGAGRASSPPCSLLMR